MLKVGLTGNIGSGKSTVARIFEILEVPVFYADVHGKMMFQKPEIQQKIKVLFGAEVFDDGSINRQKLAKIVFSESEKLKQLNAIIHPAVSSAFETSAKAFSNHPYIIYEAAIMMESGSYKNMDKIIVVTADKDLRLSRVTQRDGTTSEDVLKRMENQWPEEKKLQFADYVINNNQNQMLIPQVLNIHRQLIELSGK